MDRQSLKGDALILGAVATWALAYPVAKGALDPATGWGKHFCTFVAMRFFLAFAIFLPVVLWRYGLNLKKYGPFQKFCNSHLDTK